MSTPLAAADVDALRAYSTPTICNAIETFDVRPRTEGFMDPSIVCRFPELGRMVGYAVTATMRASAPDDPELSLRDVIQPFASIPKPWIVVVEDLDLTPVGSIWGEVNATAFQSLGAVGAITNGGVRDLSEVRAIGFHFFSPIVLVSHAYARFVASGDPVTVGGLTVASGDLLHADEHGVTAIPLQIARDLPAAARKIEEQERRFIDYARSPDADREQLMRLYEKVD